MFSNKIRHFVPRSFQWTQQEIRIQKLFCQYLNGNIEWDSTSERLSNLTNQMGSPWVVDPFKVSSHCVVCALVPAKRHQSLCCSKPFRCFRMWFSTWGWLSEWSIWTFLSNEVVVPYNIWFWSRDFVWRSTGASTENNHALVVCINQQ